jgi:uncharacterized protein with FMN-binding domain
MFKSSLLRSSIAALTTLGLLLSVPHVQAASQPARQLTVQHTDAKMLDIGLKEGRFQGRVVDHAGSPVANAPVVIRQGEKEVAKTTTNQHGQFAVTGLKGGVYEVSSGKTVGIYRVWQETATPPAAKEQALLILGQNGERGQFGSMGGGVVLLAAISIAALVIALIALNEALDDEPESP